jgi:hypothetical protein
MHPEKSSSGFRNLSPLVSSLIIVNLSWNFSYFFLLQIISIFPFAQFDITREDIVFKPKSFSKYSLLHARFLSLFFFDKSAVFQSHPTHVLDYFLVLRPFSKMVVFTLKPSLIIYLHFWNCIVVIYLNFYIEEEAQRHFFFLILNMLVLVSAGFLLFSLIDRNNF